MNDKVKELLADWEIARQDGDHLSAEELCRDCPELLPELKEGIEKLLHTSWLFESRSTAPSEPISPTLKTQTELLQSLRDHELVPLNEIENVDKDEAAESIAVRLCDAGFLTRYQSDVLLGYKSGPIKLDRYLVLDEVGEGGMGKVYKAIHMSMKRNVAIKMLSSGSISDERKARFRREIQSVASLDHPNIVTAYDACEVDGQFFLAMELIDGEDLTDIIKLHGPMDFEAAASTIAQIAKAADSAHRQGIIHRDIKPSNILLTHSGQAKLLDLGIARIQDETTNDHAGVTLQNSTEITGENVPIGTIAFMSPEQAINAKRADERSDIYSLGCTFYYLLTGKTPFPGESAVEVIVAHRESSTDDVVNSLTVPNYARNIIHRMIAKEPAARFQTMEDVVVAIESKVPVKRVRRSSSTGSNSTSRAPWVLAGLILLACCTAGAVWLNNSNGLTPPGPQLDVESETWQNDLARWVLNNAGTVSANTEFGEQFIDTLEAIPASAIEITELELSDTPTGFSARWLTRLPQLNALAIGYATLDEDDGQALAAIKTLSSLELTSCELNASFWTSLKLMPNLRWLLIDGIEPSNEALQTLQQMIQLNSLTLNNTDFSDNDFQFIAGLKNLEFLDLESTQVQGKPLAWAAQQQGLVHLDLTETNITDADIEGVPVCESLNLISFESCNVGTSAVKYVAALPQVTFAYLGGSDITDADMKLLSDNRTITNLSVDQSRITRVGLQTIAKMEQLESLSLAGMSISDDDLEPLLALDLYRLDLSNTRITEAGLQLLLEMELGELDLADCNISHDAMQDFVQQNPDCIVLTSELFPID